MDRRVTLQRATTATNAFGEGVPTWAALATVWAKFQPVSDGEKWRAGMVEAREFARFTIRYSSTVASLSGKDRLLFEGAVWSITGVKEIGRRVDIEITAERVAA